MCSLCKLFWLLLRLRLRDRGELGNNKCTGNEKAKNFFAAKKGNTLGVSKYYVKSECNFLLQILKLLWKIEKNYFWCLYEQNKWHLQLHILYGIQQKEEINFLNNNLTDNRAAHYSYITKTIQNVRWSLKDNWARARAYKFDKRKAEKIFNNAACFLCYLYTDCYILIKCTLRQCYVHTTSDAQLHLPPTGSKAK